MLVQLALNQALIMQKQARDSDQTNLATKNHGTVHGDCVKLYGETVFHLNRTLECLHVKQNCPPVDAQTWLSTALTNIQTCRHGTYELRGVEDFKAPVVSNNVTEMIRNSLAVNMDLMKHHHTVEKTEDAFPSWFSTHERKLLQASSIKAQVVVAKDGSGNFGTVQDALNAAANRSVKTRFVIHVKKGVYRENIEVAVLNDNIMLVGDGLRNTIITSGRSVQDGYTTYSSATAGIDGLHFIARDITFQNTAGPHKGQAVALRSASDLSVFYRCAIMGYQDTLMAHAQRQFYRQCYIYGTVDFIFGNAAVVFQNCYIFVRRPLEGQANMITAQGRGDPFQNTGISIHDSQIRAASDLRPVVDKYNTFLGRPWQQYARVVVMKTFMDTLVNPLGWSPWDNSDSAQDTLFFGEYQNYGPGASTTGRVKWPGFHVITSPAEASQFTVTGLLGGPTWLESLATMAKSLGLIIVFLSLFSLSSPALSSIFSNAIDFWCNKTPHPQTCKHFATTNHHHLQDGIPKSAFQFKNLILRIAMDQSVKAQIHIMWLGSKCESKQEKAAWSDCITLYQDTINILNQALNPTKQSTSYDLQTWLSTALTNIDTCQTGFQELGVGNNVLPLIPNKNISEIISDFLALNNASSLIPPKTNKNGFPRWLSPNDRKLLESPSLSPDVVVAKDGSGNFKTIKEALKAVPKMSRKRFVIYVKRGVYNENIEIGNSLKNIMLYGDGTRLTIISGSRSVGAGSTTFNSATVAITGDGFIARGITFRNTAGPQNHQAVALRCGADLSVFYRCAFEGHQDTLYVHSQRQFYKECHIYGTVDFIFGNAAVVFQSCNIYARRPMQKQKNAITAQGRTDPNQNTGISIQNSRVMAAEDLVPVLSSFKTFLGRPWKEYSRTVFLQTYLDALVDPAGWLEWKGDFALETLYYGEYNNLGPRGSTRGRVKWRGYRVMTSATEASKFTVENFIAGRSWLPATGIPFFSGLYD
ncbi:Pectinesterase 2 [Spatholobus suberectus]|nr:Pectinesterase 2 [Spatholobus suberectus]